uniref:Coiled-coil domain containing 12 n=1 Tax=Cyprinus carpio carpio TaxID=630221 RepID=A0A8C1EFS0_CYPCA
MKNPLCSHGDPAADFAVTCRDVNRAMVLLGLLQPLSAVRLLSLDTVRELKLRNYTPEDKELKERQVPKAKPASVEDKVKDQLEAADPEPVIEEVDLANLAPRKPDWDLKRDVAKKLEKLERRTQKAIAELIRDRLKGSEEELAGVVGAVGMEEGDSD